LARANYHEERRRLHPLHKKSRGLLHRARPAQQSTPFHQKIYNLSSLIPNDANPSAPQSLQKRATSFYNFFTGHTPNQQTRLRPKISKKPLLEEPMA
jgi:hypothetical protein